MPVNPNDLRRMAISREQLHWLLVGGKVAFPDFGIFLVPDVEVTRFAQKGQTKEHGGVMIARPPKKEQ